MLPVVSVLRKEIGLHHPTTDKWRQEANELRIQATQGTDHNVQGKDFKTFQEMSCRKDAIKRRIDSDPANSTECWQWFALCLTTRCHTDELHSVLLDSMRQCPRSVVVPYTYKSSQNPLHRSYSPDKHMSKVNLSKLLSQAMASPQDNTPWPRPIHGLRKSHSTLVMSSNASYRTMKQVAEAQRHSVATMLCHYNAVSPCCSVEDSTQASTPEERIASAIQQTGLSHSNVIIMKIAVNLMGMNLLHGLSTAVIQTCKNVQNRAWPSCRTHAHQEANECDALQEENSSTIYLLNNAIKLRIQCGQSCSKKLIVVHKYGMREARKITGKA
ncbi:hypothetical protein PSENEW3n2_00000855 [Picochlorum sp. SENEW3]|nr:hypothetical protein PSENEW3n2_00000855 [Picochlorum sp. SENEW3]WPT15777.1 hypothetical protein PSENEW3_00000855 [Picochlorum sp. SENEW3]